MADNSHSILFVCFGNVCRSTMAEAICKELLKQRHSGDKWYVDSAGQGRWHIGETPSSRTLCVLERNGIVGFTHLARLMTREDFYQFKYILCMDEYNLDNLEYMRPEGCRAVIQMLGDYDPLRRRDNPTTIFDPYFTQDIEAYEEVYRQCRRCLEEFLNKICPIQRKRLASSTASANLYTRTSSTS